MIRILHIIEQLPLGGAENLLLTLARNINRDKFNLIFCCLRDEGYVADRLREEGFKVICQRKHRLRFLHRKILDIVKLIKAEKIDIVHTHLIEGNAWGRISAHLSSASVVCKTEHAILNDVWRKKTVKQYLYLVLNRILDKLSKSIIYVSKAQRDLINRGRYNASKHIVIHNAFDEKRLTTNRTREKVRSQCGYSESDIVIGAVGRLVHHKGYTYLLEAVNGLDELYKKNVKIMVIGTGIEEKRLKGLARRLGLNVSFLSTRDDVLELMKAMDIFVQPAFREPFGITVIEAMFSGLPVVATKSGGILEIVVDGETGILVSPKNSNSIKDAILKLISNLGLAKRMGEKGREIAISKFNGRRYAKDMEKFYSSLMEESLICTAAI